MLVKDIYGDRNNYQSLGLPPDIIASTFGKAIHHPKASSEFTDADKARSLLYMISNDIGQISSLYAMLHKVSFHTNVFPCVIRSIEYVSQVKTIFFGGFFLRHHPVSMHTVSFSVNFWTKGEVQAMFLRHEGYLGAIGAFLRGAESYNAADYSWRENLYGSSGFPASPPTAPGFPSSGPTYPKSEDAPVIDIDHLEIERSDKKLRFCPLLLRPKEYNPDTVDLTRDDDAREYWLQCLEDSLPKFTERAIQSQEGRRADAAERAERFRRTFSSRLRQLGPNPFSFGNLTVRSLLDLREQCLIEFDFPDPYLRQKRMENEQALSLLPERMGELGKMEWEERQRQLAVGMLAGNVFDWGAKEVR